MINSKKALEFASNPVYGHILSTQSNNVYTWKLHADKKLTVTYDCSSNLIYLALMETAAVLLNQKNLGNLFSLRYKEAESFLRDRNDIPAFKEDYEGIFQELILSLTSEFFSYHQKNMQILGQFIEENRYWMEIFKSLEGVEFILKESNILYFFNKRTDSIVSFPFSE